MAYLNGKKLLSVVKTEYVPAVYQEKTISPANFQREVVADSGYAALSKVKINGILIDPHTEIESQTDNSVKYQKVIPNNVLTYGGLSKLGGLTKKYNQVRTNETINGSGSLNLGWAKLGTSICPLNYGHKYYVSFDVKYASDNEYTGNSCFKLGNDSYSDYVISTADMTTTFKHYSKIDTLVLNNQSSNQAFFQKLTSNSVKFSIEWQNVQIVDLTVIYGTGNEPTSVDDFLNDYPIFRSYVPYTTGAMDYAYTKKVDITGFNIWDEEWELGGLNSLTGEPYARNDEIRSKNFSKVIPNSLYFFKTPYQVLVCWYDKQQNFVSVSYLTNQLVTTPKNAYYFKFASNVVATTYNNDICINVSNNTLNGTYKPSYRNALLEAKIVAIKQKLVSLGYSADVLGYGLPNVYNYIDLENKQVVLNMLNADLGTSTWTYNNEAKAWYTPFVGKLPADHYTKANILSEKYTTDTVGNCYGDENKVNTIYVNIYGSLFVNNGSSTTPPTGILIYELDTPVTVDVSDILDNDDIIGELESGGTITFENDNKYNLPSNVTYLVEV